MGIYCQLNQPYHLPDYEFESLERQRKKKSTAHLFPIAATRAPGRLVRQTGT